MVKKVSSFFKGTYLGLMLLFLYAPILFLILYSFNDSFTLGNWVGFTFKNYVKLLNDREVVKAIMTTLELAIVSSIVATGVGTAAAIGLMSLKKRFRTLVLNVSQLPMVNPDLVTGISFMMLFTFMNMLRGKIGMGNMDDMLRLLIAHISFNLPYVIFSVLPRLRQSSNMMYEAAMDLGCTPLQAVWKVVIPDIRPGIVSGFIMAFTMSLDDFVVSYFAGNGLHNNLSMYIYSAVGKAKGVNPAISTIIFIPVVTLLLIVNIRSLRKEREDEIQNKKVKLKKGNEA